MLQIGQPYKNTYLYCLTSFFPPLRHSFRISKKNNAAKRSLFNFSTAEDIEQGY